MEHLLTLSHKPQLGLIGESEVEGVHITHLIVSKQAVLMEGKEFPHVP